MLKAFELVIGLDHRQAVAVSGDHGERAWLEHQQRAIQRVTGFFEGDREGGLGDGVRQELRGNFHQRVRESRERWEIIFGHADQLVVAAVADDVHPMIFQELEFHFAFGQQAQQLEKFLGGDRAGAFFFYLGVAGRADAEFQIGGGDGEAAAFRFHQKIREDGNGGLALDDALRQFEFVQQVRSFYAEFHLGQPSQFSS